MGLVILMIILVIIAIVVCVFVQWVEEEPLFTGIAAIICVIVLAMFGFGNYFANFNNDHVATCHVNSKDRGGDDGSYRIYTENCGVLANKDTLLRGKFNSADIWNEIPDSGDVKFHIAGTRIHLWSQFPNVLEIVR